MSEKTEQIEERIEELQEEYSGTKYNKATNKHLGILRFKIAKAKRELEEASKRVRGKGFFVKKAGDATVALVGFPSAGKSSLINILTNVKSKTAPYAFTTTTIIPATMLYRDAHIQVFDLPGIIENAHIGSGSGTTVITAARAADLIVFVISIESVANLPVLISELEGVNVYINRKKPRIRIKKELTGGLKIEVNKSGLPDRVLSEILIGMGIHNARVQLWDETTEDELIALISNRSQYINAMVALNKVDLNPAYETIAEQMRYRYRMDVVPISATEKRNIDMLRDQMYKNLGIMRIYLKPKSAGSREDPITVAKNSNVGDVARILHTQIVNELKSAYVAGPSVKFRNQRVGVAHVLEDGDVVTFIKA
jgi:small GTP-binding protein